GEGEEGKGAREGGRGGRRKGEKEGERGAGSVADRDDSVSIGNSATGTTRTLANVSAGTAPTDAVNVQQLNDSVTNLSNRIEHDRRDANGGIAAAVAIASLPQAPAPGKSMVAIGGGTYGGQSAMALGISTYAGHWILKANGSTDTRGTVAAGVGAGFVW
ncbi:YadA family autotransporter adhesin, partial [Burkholderia cepacia]|uniref:YadA family autotransporter adhesin n=1 Tax=Burkholderia cepacia TaxID=292 RepID=UPI003BFA7089